MTPRGLVAWMLLADARRRSDRLLDLEMQMVVASGDKNSLKKLVTKLEKEP